MVVPSVLGDTFVSQLPPHGPAASVEGGHACRIGGGGGGLGGLGGGTGGNGGLGLGGGGGGGGADCSSDLPGAAATTPDPLTHNAAAAAVSHVARICRCRFFPINS
jgi:hypothetical protein